MIRPASVVPATVMAVLAFALLAPISPPAAAAGKEDAAAQSLGRFGDWEGFVEGPRDAKVCYAASLPKHVRNAPRERGRAYVTVTDRPAEKSFGVVSFTPGYPFRKGAPVEVVVDATKFVLYAAQDSAWTRDDKAVVEAMMRGRDMEFHGVPAKGEMVVDAYGLDGFTDAHAAIDKACGLKG